LLLVESNTRSQ